MADTTYQPKCYRKQGGDEFVVASGGKINIESGGTIEVAGVDLLDEIAALSGLDSGELGVLNGVTAGTVAASKAVVVDANKDIGTFRHLTISGNFVTGSTTLSEAELGVLDAVTAGTIAASKAAVVDSNKRVNEWTVSGVLQLGTTATAALALGGGTSTTPLTSASTSKNFVGFWTQSTDATGTDMRGMYFRHYLAGAGGAQSGEAVRAYCTVSASAANAARGIHSSLDFGTSGDIAGLGVAVDATLHVPNGNLGGTTAAISADINADGASSNNTGTMSFIRTSLQGDATGVSNLQDVYLLSVEGTGSAAAYNSGEMYVLTNSGAIAEAIKIKTPAGDRWIPLLSATVAP
jgi:hypothetical protein